MEFNSAFNGLITDYYFFYHFICSLMAEAKLIPIDSVQVKSCV